MKNCQHSWLITYDDSPEIRANFSFANIYEWELQYGMNNYMQGKADKGNELFIAKYDLSSLSINVGQAFKTRQLSLFSESR
jgi:DNA adenine methylase